MPALIESGYTGFKSVFIRVHLWLINHARGQELT